MKDTQRVIDNLLLSRRAQFLKFSPFVYKRNQKKDIHKKYKVTKKLPVAGKIVTKLRYSYFFQKVTKLLRNKLQVT